MDLKLKEDGWWTDVLEVTPGGESRNLGLGLENRNPKYTGPKSFGSHCVSTGWP
jgi:hypothetical protein